MSHRAVVSTIKSEGAAVLKKIFQAIHIRSRISHKLMITSGETATINSKEHFLTTLVFLCTKKNTLILQYKFIMFSIKPKKDLHTADNISVI